MGWFPDQPGGLNRFFQSLVTALAREGPRPRAIVVGPVADPPPGLVVTSDRRAMLAPRLLHYASAARQASSDAGVVDAHFALYAAWPVLAGRLRKVPLVVHFQGPWAGESQAIGQASARVWAKRRLEAAVYRKAARVVTLSAAFKRLLVEEYRIVPWKISVIAPGVDLDAFHPVSASMRDEIRRGLGVSQGGSVVLTVRRLVPRMGIDVLLHAWQLVQREANSEVEGPVLLVGGTGPERRRLEALAASLGVDGSVRFLGALPEADLVSCYQAADLTVVPSVALEGFGLVVLESLASGTPVLATSVGGLPDALAGLEQDLLVGPGDPQALAKRVTAALSGAQPVPDPAECRRYAEGFSWARAAQATRAVYDRAARPRRTRKLRVVYLDHCARLSGGEIALERLLVALEHDVEAHVILAEAGPLVDRLQRAAISVEVLPTREVARGHPKGALRTFPLPLASIGATGAYVARLAQTLRRYRPDLVHTNSLKAAVYGALAARLSGLPAVWHLRDRIADDYLPQAAIGLMRELARLPSAVIANSATTLAAFDAIAPAKRVPRFLIHGVVVLEAPQAGTAARFGSGELGDSEPARVGMVGRLAPWKGQHVFLEAFARAFPSGSEQAVVVGSSLFGEEAYEAELRRRASSLGLEDRVEFRGFRERVVDELARFDFLVQASLLPEPFGQTVIEGMAAGMAVVAPDAGGPAEVIHDGMNGLLYRSGDVDELARAMKRLAADKELRNRLGAAARARAQEFTPDVIGPKVMSVYDEVLADRTARGGTLA